MRRRHRHFTEGSWQQTGELAAGTIQLDNTISMDPSDPESYTFPGQTTCCPWEITPRARELADRALAINPKSAEARMIKAAALYLDPALAEDPDAAPELIEAMLEETLSDPDTLYRRIGTGMLDFQAYLALLEGEPDRALDQFEAHATIPPRKTTDTERFDSGFEHWSTLAIYSRLLREAGRTEQAEKIASRLEWINEESAAEWAGGALNAAALGLLIQTRVGSVEEEIIIGWIQELHDLGAFYMWRPRLILHTGLLLIEDQQGLVDVLGLFEQSSAVALTEYMASADEY